ncbi:universal stress protein [Pistricoccus aurantiacus]|uniref:universal stress protein n=1 Tax=Pistricoccus aurantiacus TaxID=1883414 RepID=UPI003640FBD0
MNTGINSILCCVSLHRDSRAVLEYAAKLAIATGARLCVLHTVKALDDDVMNTLKANIRNQDTLSDLMSQRLDQARQQIDAKLEAFWENHPQEKQALGGKEILVEVMEGYPAAVIVQEATRRGVDMIVMATNKRGFSASYAGRITKGVIKRAHVPVVVVPPPA